MKHQIEKPFDHVMQFFTPELFIRFNSSDDAEANRADADWELAIQGYCNHLDGLRDQMPAQVKALADLCLHDAEILTQDGQMYDRSCAIENNHILTWLSCFMPPAKLGVAILSVKLGDEIVSLNYVLWDRIRRYASIESWPFSKLKTHWMYDEIDVCNMNSGMFIHRILLSDGAILEIPFLTALIHSIPLNEECRNDASRQIA